MPAYRKSNPNITVITRDNFIISTPKVSSESPSSSTEEIEEVQSSRLYCSICAQSFLKQTALSRHIQTVHRSENASSPALSSAKSSKSKSTRYIKTFTCMEPSCGKTTRSHAKMADHYKRFPNHMNSSPSPCSCSSKIPSDFLSFAIIRAFVPLDVYELLHPILAMMPLWLGFSAGLFTIYEETILLQPFWELLGAWSVNESSQVYVQKIKQGKAITDFALQQQLIVILCRLAMTSNPKYTTLKFPMTQLEAQICAQKYARQVAEIEQAANEATELWQAPMASTMNDGFQNFVTTFAPPYTMLTTPTEIYPQEQQPIIDFGIPQMLDASSASLTPEWMPSFDMFSSLETSPSCSFDSMVYQLPPAPFDASPENVPYVDPFALYNPEQYQIPNQGYSYEDASATASPSSLLSGDSSIDDLFSLAGF